MNIFYTEEKLLVYNQRQNLSFLYNLDQHKINMSQNSQVSTGLFPTGNAPLFFGYSHPNTTTTNTSGTSATIMSSNVFGSSFCSNAQKRNAPESNSGEFGSTNLSTTTIKDSKFSDDTFHKKITFGGGSAPKTTASTSSTMTKCNKEGSLFSPNTPISNTSNFSNTNKNNAFCSNFGFGSSGGGEFLRSVQPQFSVHRMIGTTPEFLKLGQLGVINSTYIWKISNFNATCSAQGMAVCTSPLFKIGLPDEEKSCRMYLYPRGNSEFYKEYVSIFIECPNNVNAETDIRFSILDSNLQITHESSPNEVMTVINPLAVVLQLYGCNQYIKQDIILNKANGLLTNDTLTIACQISLKSINIKPVIPPQVQMSDGFKHLLKSNKFCDLVLEVQDEKFNVHKSILAARSSTFYEMIDDDKSNAGGKKLILDIKPEVMKEVIQFIYTGNVDNITEIANELLVAACTFKLDDLKRLCEEYLFKTLDVSNVIDIHIFAESNNANWLKDKTTNFIIANACEVIATSDYKKLVESHSQLLNELFCEMSRQKKIEKQETPIISL